MRLSFLILPANSCLFQEKAQKFTPAWSPLSPRGSAGLSGIPQTELCKDTQLILTPLEAGNLRPSQQLAGCLLQWPGLAGAGCLPGIIHSLSPGSGL